MSRAALRVCLAAAVVATAVPAARAATVLLESLAGRQVFPVDNWWNLDISADPSMRARRS